MKQTSAEVIIFSDGASKGNPGPGGWGAVVIFDKQEVIELGDAAAGTTNNQMELTAAVAGLMQLRDPGKHVVVYTDSSYLVSGITKWIEGWKKRDWRTATGDPVLNRDLWKELDHYTGMFDVEYRLLPGHAGVPGNERADEIASDYASGMNPFLYSGPLDGYEFKDTIFDLGSKPEQLEKKRKKTRSGVAYSYVSLVDGVVERHATWEECKKRVHGKPARFRKTFSPEDERALMNEWRNLHGGK